MIDESYLVVDAEELNVGATVMRPTRAKVDLAHAAKVQFSGGRVRYMLNGADPTAESGRQAWDGREEELSRAELIGLGLIRADSINATVSVTYYRRR